MRGISESELSSDGEGVYSTPREERGLALGGLPPQTTSESGEPRPNVVSPLTPPDGVRDCEGGDYLGAAGRSPRGTGGATATRRVSNFAEGLDEVEK